MSPVGEIEMARSPVPARYDGDGKSIAVLHHLPVSIREFKYSM
jgi:hypothetical protein